MAIYLKNAVLKDNYNESIRLGFCTDKLLRNFFILANNIYKTLGRETDRDRDACINYAVSEAWQKWNEYVPEKSSNIFAFFTSMIMNDLRIHYNQLNHKNIKHISLSLFENNDNS